jgi:hypothetical protein
MTFKKGQSGNPKGRAPGFGAAAKYREALAQHADDLIQKAVQSALDGDQQVLTFLLARLIPIARVSDQPTKIALPEGGLSDQAQAIAESIAKGDLAPSVGSDIVAVLANVGRLRETDLLEQRLAELEKRLGGNQS